MSEVAEITYDLVGPNYEITYNDCYRASFSYSSQFDRFAVYLMETGDTRREDKLLFHSSDFGGPIWGLDAMLPALNQKLSQLGLPPFPAEVDQIKDALISAPPLPPKIVDLGMTDEEYLASLQQGFEK
ncbi:MAG: hypothetical protein AAGF93_01515 [Cyanobacteria bacterium P01_H01_bin.105]